MAPLDRRDDEPLDTPIEDEFRVGTMTLAWDGDRQQVVIECFEALDSDAAATSEEDVEDAAGQGADPTGTGGERTLLRVHLSGADARAFAARAVAVVGAGRPPCPLCADPLDAEGHICPRANGYRR